MAANTTNFIDGRICCDAVDPGRQRSFPIETGEAFDDGNERILYCIVSTLAAEQHAVTHRVNGAVVRAQ